MIYNLNYYVYNNNNTVTKQRFYVKDENGFILFV